MYQQVKGENHTIWIDTGSALGFSTCSWYEKRDGWELPECDIGIYQKSVEDISLKWNSWSLFIKVMDKTEMLSLPYFTFQYYTEDPI